MEQSKNKQLFLYMLCLIGIGISMYLTYTKVTSSSVACINAGCNTVQSSKYSELFGIPMGVFGLGFYFALFTLLFKAKESWAKLLLVWGNIYSLYLTYLELFVIKAICVWCVGSFVVIILMTILLFTKLKETQNETAQKPE
ncbi:MAG: hypothetical protein RLY61_187 [Candidatus Parcubacteria bacterium]|jgi:uncharacterized membrane protein